MAIDFVENAIKDRAKDARLEGPPERRGSADNGIPSRQSCDQAGALRKQALEALAADGVFLKRLAREVDRIVAEEHLTSRGADRGSSWSPGQCSVPATSGTWEVASSVGLDSGQELEGKPEGLSVALARRILGMEREEAGDDGCLSLGAEEVGRSVLDWGSGYRRALGRAIDSVAPGQGSVKLVEVDVVGALSQIDVSCVRDRFPQIAQLPAERRPFDTVVLAMPSPAQGSATRHREPYKDREVPRPETELLDVGRRGPVKWKRELLRRLRTLPGILKGDGEAILILPRSVRLANGYREDPTLLDGAEEVLDRAGLAITLRFDLVEEHPVAMPYVARNRPSRVVWFVRWKEAA